MDINSNVATSRLVAQERAIDVIANNVANMNTPGFKAERMQFSDWNVNVVTEVTNLITAQRAYEMNSKVITASDDMLSTLTNLR